MYCLRANGNYCGANNNTTVLCVCVYSLSMFNFSLYCLYSSCTFKALVSNLAQTNECLNSNTDLSNYQRSCFYFNQKRYSWRCSRSAPSVNIQRVASWLRGSERTCCNVLHYLFTVENVPTDGQHTTTYYFNINTLNCAVSSIL